MAWLIDTDVAIHLRDGSHEITLRLLGLSAPPLLSLVSLVELLGGASGASPVAVQRRLHLECLLEEVDVVGFDRAAVEVYGTIVKQLGFARAHVLDRLIAATALVHGLTLITINGADFRDIPDLKLEVWSTPDQ